MNSLWWWCFLNKNEVKSTWASLLCHGSVTATGKVMKIGEPERTMGPPLKRGSVGFRDRYGVNERMSGVEEQPQGKALCQQAGKLGFLGQSEVCYALPGSGDPEGFCWIFCVVGKGEWLHPALRLGIKMSRSLPEDRPEGLSLSHRRRYQTLDMGMIADMMVMGR